MCHFSPLGIFASFDDFKIVTAEHLARGRY